MKTLLEVPLKCCPVELSGWDASECFFVEKTTLDWNSDGTYHALLRRKLRSGAVVFVRIMDSTGAGTNPPSAYRVERVGEPGLRGIREFVLKLLRIGDSRDSEIN